MANGLKVVSRRPLDRRDLSARLVTLTAILGDGRRNMDTSLRRAWTEVVTPEDYERHMAAVGQAQAAAALTRSLVQAAHLSPGDRLEVVGAGTGQMLDFLDPDLLRPFRLVFSDLNPRFLQVLRKRLADHRLEGTVVEDDIEKTKLAPHADLVLASLLLEHLDWKEGVKALAGMHPGACGIVLQENPPGMASAVTPGRPLPPSMAEAMAFAHPVLVPKDRLIEAMDQAGYRCRFTESVSVADGKHLVGLLFESRRNPKLRTES